MSGYTKGPWVSGIIGVKGGFGPDCNDKVCAVLSDDGTICEGLNCDDARLIASAPELLEALLIARTYVASSGENGSALAMNTIDAAIRKAKGEA